MDHAMNLLTYEDWNDQDLEEFEDIVESLYPLYDGDAFDIDHEEFHLGDERHVVSEDETERGIRP